MENAHFNARDLGGNQHGQSGRHLCIRTKGDSEAMGMTRKIKIGSTYIIKPSQFGGGEKAKVVGLISGKGAQFQGMFYAQVESPYRVQSYVVPDGTNSIIYNSILAANELGEEVTDV